MYHISITYLYLYIWYMTKNIWIFFFHIVNLLEYHEMYICHRLKYVVIKMILYRYMWLKQSVDSGTDHHIFIINR